MSQILKQKQVSRYVKELRAGILPIAVNWSNGGSPAIIQFSDGGSSFGSCIRCTNPRCMQYSSDELQLNIFHEFPADENNQVCPTGAIEWEDDNNSPTIDSENCIICGLCVLRCPVKAIFINEGTAHVNDGPNDYFLESQVISNEIVTNDTIRKFKDIKEYEIILRESDDIFRYFYDKVRQIEKNQTAQFPNHLARNLLIAVGIDTAMRRRGDTNVRMDLIMEPVGIDHGTGEVEFGNSIIDAPRNVLDDVAILVARYRISKDTIIPFVVTFDLPNQRSEYWRVIKDVRKVLGLKINTITIGALLILIWNRAKVVFVDSEEFYIDTQNSDLRPKLEAIIGRKLNLSSGYPGQFESPK